MGYQESMLVCNTKENFEKLCKKLNASKTELSDFVSVYAIGKTKATLMLSDPWDEPRAAMNLRSSASMTAWELSSCAKQESLAVSSQARTLPLV